MTTHEFNNNSNQAERRRVERDTYLTRAQSDADLTASGRFKKETSTRITGVPAYPSLPASSPWSSGFDQNLEPPFGVDVGEMPAVGTEQEIQDSLDAVAARVDASSPSVETPAASMPSSGGALAFPTSPAVEPPDDASLAVPSTLKLRGF